MANALGTVNALANNANSAASGSYTFLGNIDFTTAPPGECFVEVSVQASASPSGNKMAVLYATTSLDGSAFSITPSSSQAPNAHQFGQISLPDTTAVRSKSFALSPFLGGGLVQKVGIYLFNDSGVALAATGQTGQYRFETFG